jgi:hypothetical protein
MDTEERAMEDDHRLTAGLKYLNQVQTRLRTGTALKTRHWWRNL